MKLLDALIPTPRLVEVNAVDVLAAPDEAWAAVRELDLSESPLARALFGLRTAKRVTLSVSELRSTPEKPGFQLLIEDAPRGFAVGAIGQVWRFDIPFVHVANAQEFAEYCAPGEIKVAWAILVEPLFNAGSRITVEVRVDATDEASWHKFRTYFAVIGPASRLIRRVLLGRISERLGRIDACDEGRASAGDVSEGRRPRDGVRDVIAGGAGAAIMLASLLTPFLRNERSHWGLTEAEGNAPRVGDELVPRPRWQWTHAIEIEAPAEDVWPWVAQLGADRAGFYSYQFLENLVGCKLRNAETIHPRWAVKEGGTLSLHPNVPPLKVVFLLPGHGFVAHAGPDPDSVSREKPWVAASWGFFVDPRGAGRCRFVSRYRCASSDDLATRLAFGAALMEPIGFAMDRRMLLGVRERVMRQKANRRAAVSSA
ncbi:MAG: hypothetical protein ACOY0T_32765 [Myxococcota bacterium]